MKIGTLIRVGSLAFDVAQDEKLRTLVKMAHNGAKRRGFFSPPQSPSAPHRGGYHPGVPPYHNRLFPPRW